jgi:copper chaperone CopZ
MESNFDVDINCAACFNDVLDALRESPGVIAVEGSIQHGCVHVVHDGDEATLGALIAGVGNRWSVADNGEYLQDEVHVSGGHTCRVGR